jgi:hypothetical protein
MNNHTWEEQTRRLLDEARIEQAAVEMQISELQEKQISLAREVEAYETALMGYLMRTGREEVMEYDWKEILANDKHHKERLITIAKHNGGRIGQSKATDILYGNKLIRAKKRSTAYSMVQTYLADMVEQGIFQKLRPGEYELVGAQQKFTIV